MIAAILPIPLSSCKFSFDGAFFFSIIFYLCFPLCPQSETDLIKVCHCETAIWGQMKKKWKNDEILFSILTYRLINFKNRLMIVLKGAYKVEEFDMLGLNQRKEFICLQSLPHKGCVQRPTSCLSIINLISSEYSGCMI